MSKLTSKIVIGISFEISLIVGLICHHSNKKQDKEMRELMDRIRQEREERNKNLNKILDEINNVYPDCKHAETVARLDAFMNELEQLDTIKNYKAKHKVPDQFTISIFDEKTGEELTFEDVMYNEEKKKRTLVFKGDGKVYLR